jgi:5'-nucleotidase/UDP-sugar diphosphatase
MQMTRHAKQSTFRLAHAARLGSRTSRTPIPGGVAMGGGVMGGLLMGGLLMGSLALSAMGCDDKDSTDFFQDAGVAGGAAGEGAGDSGGAAGVADGGAARSPQKLVILHTNDIHSHLMGFGPERDYTPATPDDDATRGGMARLATAIGRARAEAQAGGARVLLLDAGDFMMGSLFELLANQAVPELTLMQALGYDATTVGNHELDWTPLGLAAILQAATAKGVTLPVLSSNMKFSSASADTGDDALEALGVLRPKLVKTVGSIKVGFFGLLGANAVQVTPQARPLTFEATDVAAARMVAELREVDRVDLVIALSHSGINAQGQGEDAELAAAVPGIDIIISGHSHDTLQQPFQVGETSIVTAGSYTANLGQLAVTVTPSASAGERASVAVDAYTLLDIDDSVPGDATTQATVEQYIAGLDIAALMPRGLAYREVIAKTPADLLLPAAAEAPIGNLVSDAYRSVVSALEPSDAPALAFDANGQLRAPIQRGSTGEVWFADLFRVLPIGIGPDQVPGYPLVSFYLNARDIRSGLELGGAPELGGNEVLLQLSGMKVAYDTSRPPFQRVAGLSLVTADGDQALDVTDTTTCYRVVTTNYVAGLLGLVSTVSGGQLSVEAKDADCTTLVDPTTRFVDADPATAGIQELKHWQALYSFVSQLPDADSDGIPDIPSAYAAPQGRILGL